MRHFSNITAFVFHISEVPQLDRSINRGCCHQPVTARVEFCMGHFGFVQLLFENLNMFSKIRISALLLILAMRTDLYISLTYLMSIQAKQEKSSSVVPSRKHLAANGHVHTAVPVTGRVRFVALKPYTEIYIFM